MEYAAKAYVGVVATQVVNGMPASELARVLSAILTHCGHPAMTAAAVGDRMMDASGIEGADAQCLRFHVYAFLKICLAPPGQREQKAAEMGELLGELTAALAASPGSSTATSA